MKIIILRHGEATYSASDRVLSLEGQRQVAATANKLNAHYKVTTCISSNKTRALQTAKIACNVLGFKGEVEIDKELSPSGNPAHIVSYLDTFEMGSSVVLIVSHLPLVEILAYELNLKITLPPSFDTADALVVDYNGKRGKYVAFYKPFEDTKFF